MELMRVDVCECLSECVCERARRSPWWERERESICVCVRVCAYVCVWVKKSVVVQVRHNECVREWVCNCSLTSVSECVFACVCRCAQVKEIECECVRGRMSSWLSINTCRRRHILGRIRGFLLLLLLRLLRPHPTSKVAGSRSKPDQTGNQLLRNLIF